MIPQQLFVELTCALETECLHDQMLRIVVKNPLLMDTHGVSLANYGAKNEELGYGLTDHIVYLQYWNLTLFLIELFWFMFFVLLQLNICLAFFICEEVRIKCLPLGSRCFDALLLALSMDKLSF